MQPGDTCWIREGVYRKAINQFGFEQKRFFLAKGALDAAGEWWLDTKRSELLFIPPGNSGDPNQLEVTVKNRVAGFEEEGVSAIVSAIESIEFRGCNLRSDECRKNVVRNCRFLYPSTPKIFPDGKNALQMQKNLRLKV